MFRFVGFLVCSTILSSGSHLLAQDSPQDSLGSVLISVSEKVARISKAPFFEIRGNHPNFKYYDLIASTLSDRSKRTIKLASITGINTKQLDSRSLVIRIGKQEVQLGRGSDFSVDLTEALAKALEEKGFKDVKIVELHELKLGSNLIGRSSSSSVTPAED